MAMIFQEPMSSLNPCFTVGFQLTEALKVHLDMDKAERRARAIELLRRSAFGDAERRLGAFPHQLSGGMNQRVMIAMAISCNPQPPHRRRADHRARRHHPGADPRPAAQAAARRPAWASCSSPTTWAWSPRRRERVSVHYAGQKVEEQAVTGLFADPHHPYTAALLAALPERAHSRRLPSIPGVVPGQFDRPTGCLFSPRCRNAVEYCRLVEPKPAAAELGDALCHYPLVAGVPLDHPGREAAE